MATSFGLVPGAITRVPRLQPASEVPVERENARFVESALVALVGSIRASRVQIVKDLADLENRASGALDLAVRLREAVEAGGLACPESRVSHRVASRSRRERPARSGGGCSPVDRALGRRYGRGGIRGRLLRRWPAPVGRFAGGSVSRSSLHLRRWRRLGVCAVERFSARSATACCGGHLT